jgi:hypothetical protein
MKQPGAGQTNQLGDLGVSELGFCLEVLVAPAEHDQPGNRIAPDWPTRRAIRFGPDP